MHHRLLLFPLLAACANGPRSEGWAPAIKSDGPTVVYDVEAKPLPEIPLPNDAATRLDPSSPTGRRLNISEVATTAYERDVRAKFNRLDGFGAYAPIAVAFDAPLDLVDLSKRHNDNDDFRDDAVLVLNVDPDCKRFGEEVAVDMGRGRWSFTYFGHGRRRPDELAPGGERWDHWGNTLFPFDEHFDDNNYIYEENLEDLDRDGVLDPGEDRDQDGVLDLPNFIDPYACADFEEDTFEFDRCVADNLIGFYERETNTLLMRPLWPLEEQCTYAVLLTDRLKGTNGEPVNSPFPAINGRDQTDDLRAAEPFLSRYGLSVDQIRFAWTFTVGTMTGELKAIRQGLYGSGPLARLGEAFPPNLDLWTRKELNDVFSLPTDAEVADDHVIPGACLSHALTTLWDQGLGEWNANMCAIEADLSAVESWVFGTFQAPNFLVDKDGIATEAYPDDHDELFDVDIMTGEATYGSTTVTMMCALPYEDPTVTCAEGNPDGVPFCKPFPTVIYAHGYGSSRSEFTLHMGRHAAMGNAGCAIDSYGHGLNRWLVDPQASSTLRLSLPLFQSVQASELAALLSIGRDRDLNNDGLPDGGMDQWSADIFHTRDMVRQSAVEVMQLVRTLRSMDGTHRDADGDLLGDVDGDGIVDLGGPYNTIGHWGISLGGIISGVLVGAEPGLDAASPNAGGAGLTDISARSTQSGVPQAVVMPMMTQLVAGCLPDDGHDNPLPVGQGGGSDCLRGNGAEDATWQGGTLRLAYINQDEASTRIHEIGTVEGVQPGDTFTVTNLVTGESSTVALNGRGWARTSVAADAMDPIERRATLGWGDAPGPFQLDDPTAVGDAFEVVVRRGDTVLGVVDTFKHQVVFQGSLYPPGAPLVALQQGFGYRRNSPEVRRILSFAQHAISPGDPGVWAQHIYLDPLDASYDPLDDGQSTRALIMPTAGDSTVPVNTGIAQGRTAGLLGSWLRDDSLAPEHGWRQLFTPDPRYGKSVEQWLVDNWAYEADQRFERWAGFDRNPHVIFDPDNVSDGALRFSCGPSDWSATNGENRCPDELKTGPGEPEQFFDVPNPPPGQELRQDHARAGGLYDAFRIPVLRPSGQHGIYNAQSFRPFDADAFMVNFTARFLATGGRDVSHEPGCDCSGSAVGNFTVDGEPSFPGQQVQCEDDGVGTPPATMKVCDATCAAGWGLRTPAEAACVLR